MMWNDGGGWDWGWGGWIFMAVMMIVFWGLIIAAGFAVVHYLGVIRSTTTRSGPAGGGATAHAEALLAERFARGEIDEDEYRKRVALLREHR